MEDSPSFEVSKFSLTECKDYRLVLFESLVYARNTLSRAERRPYRHLQRKIQRVWDRSLHLRNNGEYPVFTPTLSEADIAIKSVKSYTDDLWQQLVTTNISLTPGQCTNLAHGLDILDQLQEQPVRTILESVGALGTQQDGY